MAVHVEWIAAVTTVNQARQESNASPSIISVVLIPAFIVVVFQTLPGFAIKCIKQYMPYRSRLSVTSRSDATLLLMMRVGKDKELKLCQ